MRAQPAFSLFISGQKLSALRTANSGTIAVPHVPLVPLQRKPCGGSRGPFIYVDVRWWRYYSLLICLGLDESGNSSFGASAWDEVRADLPESWWPHSNYILEIIYNSCAMYFQWNSVKGRRDLLISERDHVKDLVCAGNSSSTIKNLISPTSRKESKLIIRAMSFMNKSIIAT
jgi:hypothetical protein